MKRLNLYLIILVLVMLSACNCDKTNNCGALSEEGLASLVFNVDDTVRFENVSGGKIEFITKSKTSTPAYSEQGCKKNEFAGCDCNSHCSANGSTMAQSTTSLNGSNLYFIRVDEEAEGKIWKKSTLMFNIFDFGSSSIDLKDPTHLEIGDSLLASKQIGNHLYSNVYIFTRDTFQYPNMSIWKVYYTNTDGVVGFRERDGHSLYYLK